MIRKPKAILALLTALNLLNYLDRFVLSAVLKPLQDDLQLSNFVAGLLATVFLVGFFATSPLFGTLADRSGASGRRWLMVVGALVWSLATMASGMAKGEWSLLAARAIVGVGEASYVTIAPTVIDTIAPPAQRGRWLAIFYTAIPVGSALGYIVGGAVLSATHDWRQPFFIAGIPGIALGLLVAFIRESGTQAPRAKNNLLAAAKELFKIPLYRFVVLGNCAYTFAIGGFGFWAPKYVAERYYGARHGASDGRAAMLFGAVTVLGGALGTLVGGAMGDRAARGVSEDSGVARRNLWVCAVATGIAAPLTVAALLAPGASGFYVVTLFCEIGLFFPGGPFNVAILRSAPVHLRASAMALSIFASHLLGDLWSPALMGYVADRSSMPWAMLACPLFFGLAAIVWWRSAAVPPPARLT